MARPNPKILTETYLGSTQKLIQVAASAGVWAVTYQGDPFTLIVIKEDRVQETRRKYPKTVFTNSGHAENLARKLNHYFKSEDFDVELLTIKEKQNGRRTSKTTQS